MLSLLSSVALLLLLLLSSSLPVSSFDVYPDGIQKLVYKVLNQWYNCYKLLTIDGPVGCETPFDGLRGPIRYIDSTAALNALISSAPRDYISILITQEMFNTANVNRLRDDLHIAGVMVLRVDGAPAGGYSPVSPFPQRLPPPSPLLASLPPSTVTPSTFNRSFAWNPLGDSMRDEYYPFSIQLVLADDNGLLACARSNEAAVAAGLQPVYEVEFRNPTYAYDNSLQCLQDSRCNPVGAQSVWSTLFPIASDSRDFVVATAAIDSQSLFSLTSVGAEEMSGAIALLTAAKALSSLWDSNVTAGALSSLRHNLLFFFPHAESFDHAGSRKFVDDLLHFNCSYWSVKDAPGVDPCYRPYKYSTAFRLLSHNGTVGLRRMRQILEIGQVGLNSSLYLHTERDVNAQREQWVEEILETALNVSGITLGRASEDTPGIPPAASEAFLSVNASIPVVFISDHPREFINRYYHSQFDYGSNNLLHADGSDETSPSLCALSTLIARTLFLAAGGNSSYLHHIRADCALIVQLIICWTEDAGCAALRQFRPSTNPSAPNHIAGTWFPIRPSHYVISDSGGLPSSVYPAYINASLVSFFANSTSPSFFHDAVDPLLAYDPLDDEERFTVYGGNGSRLWTVANPIARTSRIYRVEKDVVVWSMLSTGSLLLLSAIAAVCLSRRWLKEKFKTV